MKRLNGDGSRQANIAPASGALPFIAIKTSRDQGFTLIEVLTAVMILAIALTVIMQLFSGGLKSNRLSNDYLYGIFHAREKMEEILLTQEWGPGEFSGDFEDGYRWTATIEEVMEAPESEDADGDAAREQPSPVSTLLIRLNVIWQNGDREKSFALMTTALTEKLATAETAD